MKPARRDSTGMLPKAMKYSCWLKSNLLLIGFTGVLLGFCGDALAANSLLSECYSRLEQDLVDFELSRDVDATISPRFSIEASSVSSFWLSLADYCNDQAEKYSVLATDGYNDWLDLSYGYQWLGYAYFCLFMQSGDFFTLFKTAEMFGKAAEMYINHLLFD